MVRSYLNIEIIRNRLWNRLHLWLILLFASLLMSNCTYTLPKSEIIKNAGKYREISSKKWKKDISQLKTILLKNHPNPFRNISKEEFKRRYYAFIDTLDNLTANERLVGLLKLLALLEDAHTTIDLSFLPIHHFPLRIIWTNNGPYVLAADTSLSQVIGKKLLAVNQTPVDTVMEKLRKIISHENEYWLLKNAQEYILTLEVLQGLGITRNRTVTFAFLGNEADTLRIEIETKPLYSPQISKWTDIYNVFQVEKPITKYLDSKKSFYWYKYLQGSKTLFFQYNICRNHPKLPFAVFTDKFFTEARKRSVQKIIIDLRSNTGGNSGLFTKLFLPKLQAMVKEKQIELIVLIGSGTFSSGVWATLELKNIGGILVGEPTGNNPNHFGQPIQHMLENTNILVSVSTKYWKLIPDQNPQMLKPDIPVSLKIDEILEGRDAAFQVAIAK